MNTKLKIALGISGFLAVIIGVSLAGLDRKGNDEEKQVNANWDKFAQKFPQPVESNKSALQLKQMTEKLGFILYSTQAKNDNIKLEQKAKQEIETVRKDIDDYYSNQLISNNSTIPVPSEKIRKYLTAKSSLIGEINQYILNNETPIWSYNIDYLKKGDVSYPLPSMLGIVTLEKILLIDGLEKYRLGEKEAGLKSIESAAKLTENLKNRPELIGQLVSIIANKTQNAALRKLEQIPDNLKQSLNNHDYRQSVMTSLYGESFFMYYGMRNNFNQLYGQENVGLFERLLSAPISKPYIQTAAFKDYQKQQKIYGEIEQEKNFCHINWDKLTQDNSNENNWDIFAPFSLNVGSFASQYRKGGDLMLHLELTEKILLIKSLRAKTGKLPATVSGLESSICPGEKWIYQVNPEGKKATLKFSYKLTEPNPKSSALALPFHYEF